MTTPITVRPARREDASTLLSLVDALADYEKLDRPDEAARTRLVRDGWETDSPRFSAFLALENEKPVGYGIVFETYSSFLARPTLYIEDLFILPEARRSGAGTALFRYLTGEAARRGCGRMEWMCLDWNTVGINFYQKHGATHMDDWRYYRLTEAEFRAIAADTEDGSTS